MQMLAPTVQTEGPETAGETTQAGVGQAETGQPEPLISGPAPALWAGAGAFLLIFLIGMMLIIRGRVTGGKARAGKTDSRTYFEPAGEDAEIVFDEEAEPKPEVSKAKNKDRWRDDEARETEVVIDHDHNSGSLHEDAPEADEDALAGNAAPLEPIEKPEKKKQSAFAGLFGKKPDPEPIPDDAPFYADEDVENTGFFAPEPESGSEEQEAEAIIESHAPPAPTVQQAPVPAGEAARIAHAEEAAREALKRAQDAEALARDLRRANEEAQKVMTIGLHKQEAALEQRAAAMADMERRLAAMSDEFQGRLEAVSAAAMQHSAETPLASFQEPSAPGLSEDHFSEFANLMGEQFDALRGAVNSAIEKLSKRLDHLPSAPGVGTATAARVQLSDLLGDALAPQRYKLAYKLSTGRTAEAAVMMPGPMAAIAIDARFPVEAFDAWQLSRNAGTETELRRAVLRNIADAGEKLIVPEETADCAMMFIPSENILSELHAHFSDLVQESYRARVFMVSPTSLMATLHTLSAVMAGAGVKETSASNFIDELQALRARVAALETLRQNGSATAAAKAEKPAEKTPAANAPAQYSAVFDNPPTRKSGESGEDKSPFPLR